MDGSLPITRSANSSESFERALGEVVRVGLERILAAAIETEVADFLLQHQHLRDGKDRKRVVRSGYLPTRSFSLGFGEVCVRVPRVRDRCAPSANESAIRFESRIVPRYRRGTRVPVRMVPALYLRSILSRNVVPLLTAIAGPDLSLVFSWRFQEIFLACGGREALTLPKELGSIAGGRIWLGSKALEESPGEDPETLLIAIGHVAGSGPRLIGIRPGDPRETGEWTGLLESLQDRGLAPVRDLRVTAATEAARRAVDVAESTNGSGGGAAPEPAPPERPRASVRPAGRTGARNTVDPETRNR